MDLVDEEDHVSTLLDLVDQSLDPALKLTPELCSGHQRGQIQQIKLLIRQPEGHIPGYDPLGDPFCYGSFAHAGLADQAGVVLLTAA